MTADFHIQRVKPTFTDPQEVIKYNFKDKNGALQDIITKSHIQDDRKQNLILKAQMPPKQEITRFKKHTTNPLIMNKQNEGGMRVFFVAGLCSSEERAH